MTTTISRPPADHPLLPGCLFQYKQRRPSGEEVTLCALPEGACPAQRPEGGGQVCTEPHCVFVEWQLLPDAPEAGKP
jgi:hypothetical protein